MQSEALSLLMMVKILKLALHSNLVRVVLLHLYLMQSMIFDAKLEAGASLKKMITDT
jgi:hypothetical protein